MSEEQSTEWMKMQITLTRIETTLMAFVGEQRQSNTDLAVKMADHETRLRNVERDNEQLRGSRSTMRWVTGLAASLGVISPVISWLVTRR